MRSPAYGNRPSETAGSDILAQLALDLRWSFNHSADTLWQQLDPELWDFTHNPWVVLQTVSRERLRSVTTDPDFQGLLAELHRERQKAEQSDAWFQQAHPQGLGGQNMIRQWIDFARRPDVSSRVVFLSDYDALMAEYLVQGVDVWINTPRRPMEASGTSGMKVLVNGGLNLSELDGWWAEAYSPEVGWAIGDGMEHGDDPSWDATEAEALYGLLEREVVPEFYARNEDGIPVGWVAKMRESMARLTPHRTGAFVPLEAPFVLWHDSPSWR